MAVWLSGGLLDVLLPGWWHLAAPCLALCQASGCVRAQVTILGRHEADELLLLASDGLWDVLSNQEACRCVCRSSRSAQRS